MLEKLLIVVVAIFLFVACGQKKNEKQTIHNKYDEEIFSKFEKHKREFDKILNSKNIALVEQFLAGLIQSDTVSLENYGIVSIFLTDLLNTNSATMNYPFEELKGM